jgi:hypothetical protein
MVINFKRENLTKRASELHWAPFCLAVVVDI